MSKKRILVLTDDIPCGHRSIAKAVCGFLKEQEKNNDMLVNYAEVELPFRAVNSIYPLIYRYLPASNKLSHLILENEVIRKMIIETSDKDIHILKTTYKKYKPDLVISSHFLNSHALAQWREKEKIDFKLWNVAADPWTNYSLSFVKKADINLVYDDVSYKQAIDCGIPPKKILKTGWWVRKEMYDDRLQMTDYRLQIKNRLGFEDDRPVVFIGGGSLGTNSITKFLPILLMIKSESTIIFNTGTDKLAYNTVEEFKKIFEKTKANDKVKILNYGWIENMAEVLSVCDIVFGKAGPNFLFDVVAVGKPFVAITHIGGQEDGNIDLIKKKKLGWVKEGVGEAEDFLLTYLDDPKKYNTKFAKTIAVEAKKNQQSMEIIYQKIKQTL